MKSTARLKGVECRELVESDLPACSRTAREAFPAGLSDLIAGTHGFVLVWYGEIIGYVTIDENANIIEPNRGGRVSGELTDAAVAKPYRQWVMLLLMGAWECLAARGGTWVADCLPETTYRILRGAERRGFVTIRDDAAVVFRGFPTRRLLFTVSSRVRGNEPAAVRF